MGGGSWSSNVYNTTRATYAATGKSDFDYSDRIKSGRAAAVVNPLLDPTAKAGDASAFAGTVMRECAISDEHPNPTPIVVVLDVTGSNFAAAKAVHAKLPQLLGVLQRTGGIEDPQIMFIAVGDAYSDSVPLQIGQFESDNRIDDMLEAAYLEGGGGGGNHENYELAAYYLWKHTRLESFEKQGRKGYVFFIGDERTYDKVTNEYGGHWGGSGNHTLESLLGDRLQEDIPVKEVFAGMQEQYEAFHLFQRQGSYEPSMVQPWWQTLIPAQHSMVLDDPNTVCEAIAGILAMLEAGLEVDEAQDALTSAGFDADAVAAVSKTLATVGGGGGAVATTEGSLDLGDSGTGTDRL